MQFNSDRFRVDAPSPSCLLPVPAILPQHLPSLQLLPFCLSTLTRPGWAPHMARRPSERCSGFAGAGEERQACVFSTTDLGRPSRIHANRGQASCVFCSESVLRQRLGNSRGKGVVTAALAFFHEQSPEDVYVRAAQRLRDVAGELQRRSATHVHSNKLRPELNVEEVETPLTGRVCWKPANPSATPRQKRKECMREAAPASCERCRRNFRPSMAKMDGQRPLGRRT